MDWSLMEDEYWIELDMKYPSWYMHLGYLYYHAVHANYVLGWIDINGLMAAVLVNYVLGWIDPVGVIIVIKWYKQL